MFAFFNTDELFLRRGLWAPPLAALFLFCLLIGIACTDSTRHDAAGDLDHLEAEAEDLEFNEMGEDTNSLEEDEVAEDSDSCIESDSEETDVDYDIDTIESDIDEADQLADGDTEDDWEREADFEWTYPDDPYPNKESCTLPERRLSQWILDFPRMAVNDVFFTADQSYDGTMVFPLYEVTLVSPEVEPTTFFIGAYGLNMVEGEPGIWYLSDCSANIAGGQVMRFSESDRQWIAVYDYGVYEGMYGMCNNLLLSDSRRVLWGANALATSSLGAFRWDGSEGRRLLINGESNDLYFDFGIRTVYVCHDEVYLFGFIGREGEDDVGVIMKANEEETSLDIVWEASHDDMSCSRNPILAASVNPDTCEFVASGYCLLLEGRLDDPVEIYSYNYNEPPWLTWMDWNSGTLWASADVWDDMEDPERPRFWKRLPGETDFTVVPPVGNEGEYEGWVPRQILGTDENNLYVTANVLYKYNPSTQSFEHAWKDPLLKEPWEMEYTYIRDIALSSREDGSFRVCTAGYRLPVMCRTDCHDWYEMYSASEGARAIYDTGKYIWVGGLDPDLIRLWEDGFKYYKGPRPEWTVVQSISATPDGMLYVVAWFDDAGQDVRLLATDTFNPRKDALNWDQILLDEAEEGWKPYELVTLNYKAYLHALQMDKYNDISASRIYAILEDGSLQLLEEFECEGFLQDGGDRLVFSSINGVYEIDCENGGSQVLIGPQPPTTILENIFRTAVQMDDGVWAGSGRSYFYEYDIAKDEIKYFYGSMISNYRINMYNTHQWDHTYAWEANSVPFVSRKLPTGELLLGGNHGRLFLRATDEAYWGTENNR